MMTHCEYCQALIESAYACPHCGTEPSSASDEVSLASLSRTMPELSLASRSRTEPEQAFLSADASVEPSPEADETLPFCPQNRPPVPRLTVLGDDGQAAEVLWLRAEKFEIGRTSGDLQVPHDGAISSLHARLERCFEHGRYHWQLNDLDSSNGIYVRLAEDCQLEDGQWFQIGRRLFHLDCDSRAMTQAMGNPLVTQRLGGLRQAPRGGDVELVEMGPVDEAGRQQIDGEQLVLGRSIDCDVVLSDDPTVSPRHARLSCNGSGGWLLGDLDSLNGVWVRVKSHRLHRPSEFQIGEQRFRWEGNQEQVIR